MQSTTKSKVAFEFKGAAFTIPVLHLLDSDMDVVFAELSKKVKQAAAFFHNAPIVVNLHRLDDAAQVDLAALIRLLRGQGFIPVGLTGGTEQQKDIANAMELAILTSAGINKTKQHDSLPEEETDAPEKVVAPPEATKIAVEPEKQEEIQTDAPAKEKIPALENEPVASRIVTSPIRSGQRVVVAQGDLIVTASVSSGAEIMAAGNIHVYGVLRGRALAGIDGDVNACIFCQQLEADLVSIAGNYKVNEDFPESVRSNPAQVQMQESTLLITSL